MCSCLLFSILGKLNTDVTLLEYLREGFLGIGEKRVQHRLVIELHVKIAEHFQRLGGQRHSYAAFLTIQYRKIQIDRHAAAGVIGDQELCQVVIIEAFAAELHAVAAEWLSLEWTVY